MSLRRGSSTPDRATLLLDHSGSMLGGNVHLSHCLAVWFSEAALSLGIPYEIIGFTTVDWKGAPVRNLWRRSGEGRPGRLCALRHLVYSDFADLRSPSLWPLHCYDLYRENVDGEAIEAAVARGLRHGGGRHLVIVVSDGAPVDDSTLAANDAGYLDRHLRRVVGACEADPGVELRGIGLRYDVSGYYARSVRLKRLSDVAGIAVPFLGEALTGGGPG